ILFLQEKKSYQHNQKKLSPGIHCTVPVLLALTPEAPGGRTTSVHKNSGCSGFLLSAGEISSLQNWWCPSSGWRQYDSQDAECPCHQEPPPCSPVFSMDIERDNPSTSLC